MYSTVQFPGSTVHFLLSGTLMFACAETWQIPENTFIDGRLRLCEGPKLGFLHKRYDFPIRAGGMQLYFSIPPAWTRKPMNLLPLQNGYRVLGSFSIQLVMTVIDEATGHSRGRFIRNLCPSGEASYRFEICGTARIWNSGAGLS
jgi:hypothetical protein